MDSSKDQMDALGTRRFHLVLLLLGIELLLVRFSGLSWRGMGHLVRFLVCSRDLVGRGSTCLLLVGIRRRLIAELVTGDGDVSKSMVTGVVIEIES